MKKYVCLILCGFLLLTACSNTDSSSIAVNGNETSSATELTSDVSSTVEDAGESIVSNESESVESDSDNSLGLSNIKIDSDDQLSDEQKTVIQYFDNDYMEIADYEFMQRYPQIFEGTQVSCDGTVKKVLSSSSEEYSLLVWVGKTNDQFFYRQMDKTPADYEEYLAKNENNYIVIKGKQTATRLIEGDRIELYGRYGSIDTYEVDGKSLTIPTVNVYRAYIKDDGEGSIEESVKFDADYIKSVAKTVFGNDISVRNAVSGEDYDNETFGADPYMIVEPDNQTNAKFSKFRFYMKNGYIEDAKEASRSDYINISAGKALIHRNIEFTPDFQHFYLFTFDTDLKTLNVEYYTKDFQKLWSREFEDTVNAVYDYTESHIYLVANNELYIIDTSKGEDSIAPVFIGEKTSIRKLRDSLILTSDNNSADAVMKTDLNGNIIWKSNLEDGVQFRQAQFVNDKVILEGVYREYHYIVLDLNSGEVEIDAVSMRNI